MLCPSLAWVPLPPCPLRLSEAGLPSLPPVVVSELHLCYPVQNFQPKLEPVGECPEVQRGYVQLHSSSGPWVWISLGVPSVGVPISCSSFLCNLICDGNIMWVETL